MVFELASSPLGRENLHLKPGPARALWALRWRRLEEGVN